MGSSRQAGQQVQVSLNLSSTPPPSARRSRCSGPRGRRRTSGVALVGLGLVCAAAGLTAACAPSTSPSAAPTEVTAAGSPLGDAGGGLAAALGRLASGYSFTSTVSVGGQVATQATGRWIGGASEFTVTTNAVSITYRTLPPRSWVLQAGKGWVEVNGSVPSGSPLDALKSPNQSSLVKQTSDALELTASYPAAVLGLAGDTPVAVDLVLASDGSLSATYTAPAGSATSVTTIKPDPSQAPIAAPSPS